MTTKVAAIVFCIVLAALGVFQAVLAAGAPLGQFAWGGQQSVLPTVLRIGSLISIGVYVLFAIIILERSGLLRVLPDSRFNRYGSWVVVGLLLLSVAGNMASRSPPEQFVMTPVALALFSLSAWVASR